MAFVIQAVHELYEKERESTHDDVVGKYLSTMEKQGWSLIQVIPDHRDYSAQSEDDDGIFTPGPMVGTMLVLHQPDEQA